MRPKFIQRMEELKTTPEELIESLFNIKVLAKGGEDGAKIHSEVFV